MFMMASNKHARQIIQNFNFQWRQLKLGVPTLEGRVEKSAVEHERIAQAVCAGDSRNAAKQMCSHLQNLKRELVKITKIAHYPCN
jgi:DNA-binding FadR family transcriptional regulator